MLRAQKAVRSMRIVVAEADPAARAGYMDRLAHSGFEYLQPAANCAEVLAALNRGLAARTNLDLVCLSANLPDRPGLEPLTELRGVFDVVVLLTVQGEQSELAIEGLSRGAGDFLIAPPAPGLLETKVERLLVQRLLQREVRRTTARNETLFLNILAVLAKVAEAKDPYSRYHSENVSSLASATARQMQLSDEEVRRVGVAGILHDIGKLGISEAVLRKPGSLNRSERELVERHPLVAAAILEPIEQLQAALTYIRHHHEHYDGKGYPAKLTGEEIPLGARIIHCAEAFDVMITPRPYGVVRTPAEALKELNDLAGQQFDPKVVSVFAEVTRQRGLAIGPEPDLPTLSLPEILLDLTRRVSMEDHPAKKDNGT